MKTLKIGSLAAIVACLFLFTACNKDFDTQAASSSTTSHDLNETYGAKKANDPETFNAPKNDNSKIILTDVSISFSPEIVNINNDVVITGSVTATDELMYGNLIFQRAALVDANGIPVQYVSAEQADLNANDLYEWFSVKAEKTDVTSAVHTTDGMNHTYKVSITYPATEKGTFGWRLIYKSTKGEADHGTSNPQNLEVIDCVNTLTIEPQVTGKDIGSGNYEFTVTYKLTSPTEMENIKFQGGATAGGQFQQQLKANDGFEVKHNNQNSVLTYTGSLKACTPLELSFSYVRKFSCSSSAAQVTGEWTLLSNNLEVAKVAPLVYTCN